MDCNNKNNIIIGIFIFLFGIFIISYKFLKYDIGIFNIILLGLALLLLYFTKHERLAFFWGLFIFIFGCVKILCKMPFLEERILTFTGFSILGSYFLVKFLKHQNRNCLIPGMFLIFVSAFIVLISIPGFNAFAGMIFLLCFGGTFLSAYLISRKQLGIWTVFLSLATFFVVCLLSKSGNDFGIGSFNCIYTISLALGCFSILLILNKIKNKNNNYRF